MDRIISVGIPLMANRIWPFGITYVQSLVKTIGDLPEQDRPKLFLIVSDDSLQDVCCYTPFTTIFTQVIFCGQNLTEAQSALGTQLIYCNSQHELSKLVDIIFPADPSLQATSGLPPFSLYPREEWYEGNPATVQHKYRLPDKFIFCFNPFWFQEGHLQLFRALAELQVAGQDIHLVCAGFTNDRRCPEYFREFEEYLTALDIGHLVHFFDALPEYDQIQLIRRSLFVLQPACFEGIHLFVQQCQALGKTILLPDSYYQDNPAYGWPLTDSDEKELAGQIAALTDATQPGPHKQREAEARLAARQSAVTYVKACCDMLKEWCNRRTGVPDFVKPTTKAECSNSITVATSIAPQDLDNQKEAVASWLNMGFRVVSLNGPQEASYLSSYFPDVEFIVPARTAEEKYKKPFVYLDDIFAYFDSQDIAICGIVNADIHFRHGGLYRFISDEAINSLVYGARVNITSLKDCVGEIDMWGFDYFFFDKHIIPYFPKEIYSLGIPWWDFWLPLICLGYKLPVKKIISHHAFHVTHPRRYDDDILYVLGYTFAKYVPPPFPLTDESMPAYGRFLRNLMRKCSTELCLPDP